MVVVGIGSINPVKVNAVKSALGKILPDQDLVFQELLVDHGVKEMPTSKEEALIGAENRARNALIKTNADFGVGIEGFTYDNLLGMFVDGVTVVVSKDGQVGIGSSGSFMLPELIADEIRKGKELGPIMDHYTNINNTKQNGGAVGFFTKGVINRTEALERGVVFAFIRFINSNLFNYK